MHGRTLSRTGTILSRSGIMLFLCATAMSQTVPEAKKSGDAAFARFEGTTIAAVSAKLTLARQFVHEKKFAQAEGACRQGIDILSASPDFQKYPKDQLAQVFVAEGKYQDALDIWEPLYRAQEFPDAPCTAMAIAYANTGGLPRAEQMLARYFTVHKVSFYFLSDSEVPINEQVTHDTVMATALMFHAYLQNDPKFPEDTDAEYRQAIKLAPLNSAVNYAYGLYLIAKRDQLAMGEGKPVHTWRENWEAAKPYFTTAYRHGDATVRRYVKMSFKAVSKDIN